MSELKATARGLIYEWDARQKGKMKNGKVSKPKRPKSTVIRR